MQLTKILLPVTALSISLGLFACSSTVSPSEGSDDAIASEEDGLEPFIPGFDPGKYSSKTDEPSSSTSDVTSSESEGQSATSGDESSESGTESASSGDDSSASKGDGSSTSGDENSAAAGGESSASGDEGSVSGDESSSSTSEVSSASAGKSELNTDTGEINAGEDIMSGVDDGTSSDLDDLVAACGTAEGCPEGFEKLDGDLVVEKDGSGNLSFDSFEENDYFCFSGEGSWLKLERAKLGVYIPHFKNGAAWGNLSHFEIRFEDLCSAVYIMRK